MNKSLNLQPCTHLQGCFCKQRVDNGTVTFGIMLITGWKNYKFANCNSKLKQFFVDEIATTGTKHMHIFIYSKSPIRFSTLKNRFPVAHIDKANGSVTENRDFSARRASGRVLIRNRQTLLIPLERLVMFQSLLMKILPICRSDWRNRKRTRYLRNYQAPSKICLSDKEIDTLRQTVLELLCSCWQNKQTEHFTHSWYKAENWFVIPWINFHFSEDLLYF